MLLQDCRKIAGGIQKRSKPLPPKRQTRAELQDCLYKKPEHFRTAIVRAYIACKESLEKDMYGKVDRKQLKEALYQHMYHLFPNIRAQFGNKSQFLDMATLARKIYPIDFSHLVAFDKRLFEIYCDQVRNNQEICLTESDRTRLKIVMSGNGFVPVYELQRRHLLISRFSPDYHRPDDFLVRKQSSDILLGPKETSLSNLLD